MNRGTSWTLQMENTIIDMLNLNISIPEIAIVMGRTVHSITSRINIINKKKVDSNGITESSTVSSETLHIGQPIQSPKINKQINFNSIIEKIRGKKVIILDLETTGLINDRTKFFEYWNNTVYDSCRIVEIGYWYTPCFDPNIQQLNINNYIRKPTDFFDIPQGAVDVHGISYEKAINEGFLFNKIMLNNKDDNGTICLSLYQILNTIDVFISHNTAFDFYVLLNELYRMKHFKTIQHLKNIRTNKNVICTCKHTGYKRLGNIYKSLFNCDVKVAHRAGDDVKTLIEIIINKQFDDSTNFIQKINN